MVSVIRKRKNTISISFASCHIQIWHLCLLCVDTPSNFYTITLLGDSKLKESGNHAICLSHQRVWFHISIFISLYLPKKNVHNTAFNVKVLVVLKNHFNTRFEKETSPRRQENECCLVLKYHEYNGHVMPFVIWIQDQLARQSIYN